MMVVIEIKETKLKKQKGNNKTLEESVYSYGPDSAWHSIAATSPSFWNPRA